MKRLSPSLSRWLSRLLLWLVLVAVLAVCSKVKLKLEGEECFASSECADGLTCDFGVEPWVCGPGQTDAAPPPPDAAPPLPDAADVIDAAPADARIPDANLPDAAGDGDGDGD